MISTRCPICRGPMVGPDRSAWPDFPFCSQRCKLIDLGRWLGGKYHFDAEADERSESLNRDDDPELA